MSTANDPPSPRLETCRERQLQPELAASYDASARLKPMRATTYMPLDDLDQNLRVMRVVLPRTLPPKEAAAGVALLAGRLDHPPHMLSSLPTFLDGSRSSSYRQKRVPAS
jgi:hypothetical protein